MKIYIANNKDIYFQVARIKTLKYDQYAKDFMNYRNI